MSSGYFVLLAWLIFVAAAAITIFLGMYFRRVWRRSHMGERLNLLLTVVYFFVSGVLLLGLLGAVSAIGLP